MGISWSGRRRNNYFQNPPPVPPPLPPPPPYYSTEPHPPPPPPMPPAPGNNYVFATATSSSYHGPPNSQYAPTGPNPPPPVHSHYFPGSYGQCNHPNTMMGRYNYQPYYANQPNWWAPIRPPMGQLPLPPQAPPPPFVEHQNAKKVRNDVNVHKDTLRVEVDEQNPDHHLLSFVFDALYDGSITIIYFAKEESNCKFVPQSPDAFMPLTISFQKGSGQKFRQPCGTGIDFGFFELDDLSKASPKEDVFPLVICAETRPPPHSDGHVNGTLQDASPNMQITQAVLEKRNTESFQVKVIRQILWVDGIRYELRDIFGIANSSAEGFKDTDGKECVICMTEPKDTFVLPCRHMCMCSDCAKELRLQTNKCPICRQPIEELVGIKINNDDQ
ncbi:probable E3 ubiquitin-protein ligase LUL4 [Cannabis sativa]|uniref:probable E3 ubiquitin-protein ligase LUL4 n=1 Tax=Cannabis sativa TaxID=3483 RepID=UPI0029CA4054|nr:probable E3 ubiquitin-protein ligase LUL4 [Cannabis sativa]XP_030507197.2 probable E3 ubiquitin-protein ligase LUL4 [Cannabis sativa]